VAVYLTNSFEGGSQGTTVTTGNSGGNSGSAFNTVNIGTGAAVTYDDTHAAHGTYGCLCSVPSAAEAAYCEWTTSLTGSSLPQAWVRVYLYLTSLPAVTVNMIRFVSGSTLCGAIALTASGTLQTRNEANAAQTTSSSTVPLNQWVRIEAYCVGSATAGSLQLQYFASMDATTPTETDTSGTTVNTTGTITGVTFGNSSTPSLGVWQFWMDDLGASDTGYLGPALLSASSALAGTAAATGLGSKTGAAAGSLAGTGLLAGTGTKKGSGPSLVTATGFLAPVTSVPAASAVSATAAMAGVGAKTAAGASAISATGVLAATGPPRSPAFTVGYPRSAWNAGSPQTRWQAGYPLTRWPAGQ
jgi:hypothetical protein